MIKSMTFRHRLRSSAVSAALLALLLTGCGPEPKAPSPTLNPHPHEFTKLKITVEPGSAVTGIKVESLWTVGNIGCAPHEGWPSGASITKQVNVLGKTEKIDADEWIATVVDDRFLPGKCEWNGDGYAIQFMRGQTVLSTMGRVKSDLERVDVLKLACTFNEPHEIPGGCFNKALEPTLQAHRLEIFNASVEIVKWPRKTILAPQGRDDRHAQEQAEQRHH